jgi:hypothetical protein
MVDSFSKEDIERDVWANIDKAFSEPTSRTDDQADYAPTAVFWLKQNYEILRNAREACCRERCRDRTNTRHVGTQSNGYSVQREIVDRAVLSLKDAGVPSFLIE